MGQHQGFRGFGEVILVTFYRCQDFSQSCSANYVNNLVSYSFSSKGGGRHPIGHLSVASGVGRAVMVVG